MANNIISKLRVSLGLDNSKFKSGLKQSEKQTKSFGSTIGKIGAQIGIAFGLIEVLKFGKELVNLAGEAEGIERAFNRIGGQDVFNELKSATRGTVSNLELMRKAVMAQNLGVPIENLGGLFEFAAARAADTGESVDFLVDSIVTGIGRKSPLILDNLGISAIALREKMEGVGIGTASVAQVAEAVGKIATEELDKIGKSAATSGQKLQSIAASWENIKLSIGRAVTASKEYEFVSEIIFGVNNALNKTSASQDKIKEGADRIFNAWKAQGKLNKEFSETQIAALKKENSELLRSSDIVNKSTRDRRKGNLELIKLLKEINTIPPKKIVEEVRNIATLSEKIKALKTDQEFATGSRLTDINNEIAALNKEIGVLKNLKFAIGDAASKTGITQRVSMESGPVKLNDTQMEAIKIPVKLDMSGTLADSEGFRATQDNIQNSLTGTQQQLMTTQQSLGAYGSVMGSVGQISQAFGDSTIGTFAGVASQVLSSVAQMMPALFSQSVGSAVASGAALPFPANIAAIAAGVAGVVSAFSGIGGGSASAGGSSSVTSIDTRSFTSPTTDNTTNRSTQMQAQKVDVNVTGTIKGKDIALANNQGQKQLKR